MEWESYSEERIRERGGNVYVETANGFMFGTTF